MHKVAAMGDQGKSGSTKRGLPAVKVLTNPTECWYLLGKRSVNSCGYLRSLLMQNGRALESFLAFDYCP